MPNQFARVPLLGLSRASSDTACKDGEMSQMINLRHKDGSVQPVYETKQVASFLGLHYDGVFIHKNAGYTNWIGYNTAGDGGMFWFANGVDDGVTAKTPVVTLNSNILVDNIEQMGNIIIVTNADGIHYFFFKDGGYSLIENLDRFNDIIVSAQPRQANTEPICDVVIETQSSSYKALTDVGIAKGYFTYRPDNDLSCGELITVDDTNTQVYKFTIDAGWLGYIAEKKAALDCENGWLYGYRFIRISVKLYDGNYVSHSAPILIVPPQGRDAEFMAKLLGKPGDLLSRFAYYLALYKLKYTIPNLVISDLSGVVESVDIFMSQEVPRLDYDRKQSYVPKINGVTESVLSGVCEGGSNIIRIFDRDGFADDIKETSLFYKIYSIPIGDLSTPGDYNINTKATRDILPTREQLPDDDFTHNTLIPSVSYLYNQKLHLGNIKTILFGGYSPLQLASQTFASSSKLMFQTQIRTAEGFKNVFSDIIPSGSPISLINPMIGYPDYRADKMALWAYSSGVLYKREFALAKHNNLNYAYYLDPSFSPINPLQGMTPMGGAAADVLELKKAAATNIETTPDKIKVSKVSNPFYFAAENTYSMGAQVLAFRSINESVSEGTAFGTQPLYIFTKDGIKLLHVGSGSVYYSNIVDGPREVCLNSKSVMSLKNGILFTSKRGLIHLSGLTTVCITDQLRSDFLDNMLSDDKMVTALTNPKISTLAHFTDNYSFDNIYEKILDINQMAYNDREDEVIIVSKNSLNEILCYVWNVSKNVWHVATYKVKYFVKCFDDLYYVRSDDASGLNIHDIKTQTQPMDALLVTRPMKIVPDVFKKLSRVYLRSQVRRGSVGSTGSGGVTFTINNIVDCERYQRLLVYGSNDTIDWFLIGGSDNKGDVRSLGVKTSSTAYKLFRFVYCGQPFQTSYFDCLEFDYIEVEYQVTMNNKLR